MSEYEVDGPPLRTQQFVLYFLFYSFFFWFHVSFTIKYSIKIDIAGTVYHLFTVQLEILWTHHVLDP